MTDPPVTACDTSDVLNISGPEGRWAVVTNNGRSEISSATVFLPAGKKLTVSLEPLGAVAIPAGVKLSPATTLDYANVMPLGLFADKYLVLHGPVGWKAEFSVNGIAAQADIPAGDDPAIVEHQGLTVVLINSDLATRTWAMEDALVFGPRWVGESIEEVDQAGINQFTVMTFADGKCAHRKVKPSSHAPAPPKLGAWTRVSVCREPVAEDLTWQKIDRPRGAEQLGVYYGYLWYRIEIPQAKPGKKDLFLPDCADRAIVYVNGSLVGIWGRGAGATRLPIPARFKSGRNVVTILLDDLGHSKIEPGLGETKGLAGHIFNAKPLPMRFKLKPVESFQRRIIPRQMGQLLPYLEKQKVFEAEATFSLSKVAPIHLAFTNVPHAVAISCNERSVGFFKQMEANYGDVTLGSELRKGRNVIKLLLWGDVSPKALENFRFHLLDEPITQEAAWSYRPWAMPAVGGHIVGKDQPAWYVTRFSCNDRNVPLFLHIIGARKGQIFLNGHNAGRFWTIGPQEYYYLPSCWLADNN
jgi:hypothetical protein